METPLKSMLETQLYDIDSFNSLTWHSAASGIISRWSSTSKLQKKVISFLFCHYLYPAQVVKYYFHFLPAEWLIVLMVPIWSTGTHSVKLNKTVKEMISKCCLQNVNHFVKASICYILYSVCAVLIWQVGGGYAFLTHCGLVALYGDTDMGQHWHR